MQDNIFSTVIDKGNILTYPEFITLGINRLDKREMMIAIHMNTHFNSLEIADISHLLIQLGCDMLGTILPSPKVISHKAQIKPVDHA